MIASAGTLRPAPRAIVITQKVQRLSQPSWTLRKARVRVDLPGSKSFRSSGSVEAVSRRPLASASSSSRSFSAFPTTRSTPISTISDGASSASQPVTMTAAVGLAFLSWRMSWRLFREAMAVTVQVLRMQRSAGVPGPTTRCPAFARPRAMASISPILRRQPMDSRRTCTIPSSRQTFTASEIG